MSYRVLGEAMQVVAFAFKIHSYGLQMVLRTLIAAQYVKNSQDKKQHRLILATAKRDWR